MKGMNVMLIGRSGTGKTHSLRTLAEAGVETFVLATEPGIEVVLGDTDPKKVHWHYAPAAAPGGWDSLIKQSEYVNKMTFEGLTKLPGDRNLYRQWFDMIGAMGNFVDDRTGAGFGDISKWGPDRAFVIDTLTGLTRAARQLAVGNRTALALPDYGTIQSLLEETITRLCMNLGCWFVLTSHLERETDEVTGAALLTASTLGRKLATKLPIFFDEVILAKRDGDKFIWSNMEEGVDVKRRLLPFSGRLAPSFAVIHERWKEVQNSVRK